MVGRPEARRGERIRSNRPTDPCVTTWRYGRLHGEERTYYATSVLQSRIPWVNNQKHGTAIWYHDNGKPAVEFPYVRGEIHGTATYYNDKGEMEKQLEYKHNQIVEP